MKFKGILNKIFKSPYFKNNRNKIESNDNYCYSNIVWNDSDNLIILISFSKEYFEQIIEIQDAINNEYLKLDTKIVFSSYDEEVTKEDEYENIIEELIIHKKYYMLIGGQQLDWQKLYMNIHNLGNEVLNKITIEIINNCNPIYFKDLINDGILPEFTTKDNQDTLKQLKSGRKYIDPEVLIKRLPNGFTGSDIIKFIKIYTVGETVRSNALLKIDNIIRHISNEQFKKHDLYPVYTALFNEPTVEKLSILLEPLYKQPDDDAIPGDVSDESLDAIFREHYERFSAVNDDSIYYEDIDEELEDYEEFENMQEGDKLE